jgi:hypothetical protein
MNNQWIVIGIIVGGLILREVFRRLQQPPSQTTRPNNENAGQPRDIQPQPRRRQLPPPLPRARPVEAAQLAQRPWSEPTATRGRASGGQDPPPPQPEQAAQPPAAKVLRKSLVPAAVHLAGMLRNQQNLRAAVLVREVLDVPLCKRRRIR